jgi:hypothetical protein
VVAGRTSCRGVVAPVKPAYPRGSRGRSRACGATTSRGHLTHSGAADDAAPINLLALAGESSTAVTVVALLASLVAVAVDPAARDRLRRHP